MTDEEIRKKWLKLDDQQENKNNEEQENKQEQNNGRSFSDIFGDFATGTKAQINNVYNSVQTGISRRNLVRPDPTVTQEEYDKEWENFQNLWDEKYKNNEEMQGALQRLANDNKWYSDFAKYASTIGGSMAFMPLGYGGSALDWAGKGAMATGVGAKVGIPLRLVGKGAQVAASIGDAFTAAEEAADKVIEEGGDLFQAQEAADNALPKELLTTIVPDIIFQDYITKKIGMGIGGWAKGNKFGQAILNSPIGKNAGDYVGSAATWVTDKTGSRGLGMLTNAVGTNAVNIGKELLQEHSQNIISNTEANEVLGKENSKYDLNTLKKYINSKEFWETNKGIAASMLLPGIPIAGFTARAGLGKGYSSAEATRFGENIEKFDLEREQKKYNDSVKNNENSSFSTNIHDRMNQKQKEMFEDISMAYEDKFGEKINPEEMSLSDAARMDYVLNENTLGGNTAKNNFLNRFYGENGGRIDFTSDISKEFFDNYDTEALSDLNTDRVKIEQELKQQEQQQQKAQEEIQNKMNNNEVQNSQNAKLITPNATLGKQVSQNKNNDGYIHLRMETGNPEPGQQTTNVQQKMSSVFTPKEKIGTFNKQTEDAEGINNYLYTNENRSVRLSKEGNMFYVTDENNTSKTRSFNTQEEAERFIEKIDDGSATIGGKRFMLKNGKLVSEDGEKITDAEFREKLPEEDGVISDKDENDKTIANLHSTKDLRDFYKKTRGTKDAMSPDMYLSVMSELNRIGFDGSGNIIKIMKGLGEHNEVGSREQIGKNDNGLTKAVIRLYTGYDVATAIHEIAHIGYDNLSVEKRAIYNKFAIKSHKKYVASYLGETFNEDFLNRLQYAITNKQGVLWQKIINHYPLRETVELLEYGNLTDQQLAQLTPVQKEGLQKAYEERFAQDFSTWFAEGYTKGKRPKNIIEKILNDLCKSLDMELRFISNFSKFLKAPGYEGNQFNSKNSPIAMFQEFSLQGNNEQNTNVSQQEEVQETQEQTPQETETVQQEEQVSEDTQQPVVEQQPEQQSQEIVPTNNEQQVEAFADKLFRQYKDDPQELNNILNRALENARNAQQQQFVSDVIRRIMNKFDTQQLNGNNIYLPQQGGITNEERGRITVPWDKSGYGEPRGVKRVSDTTAREIYERASEGDENAQRIFATKIPVDQQKEVIQEYEEKQRQQENERKRQEEQQKKEEKEKQKQTEQDKERDEFRKEVIDEEFWNAVGDEKFTPVGWIRGILKQTTEIEKSEMINSLKNNTTENEAIREHILKNVVKAISILQGQARSLSMPVIKNAPKTKEYLSEKINKVFNDLLQFAPEIYYHKDILGMFKNYTDLNLEKTYKNIFGRDLKEDYHKWLDKKRSQEEKEKINTKEEMASVGVPWDTSEFSFEYLRDKLDFIPRDYSLKNTTEKMARRDFERIIDDIENGNKRNSLVVNRIKLGQALFSLYTPIDIQKKIISEYNEKINKQNEEQKNAQTIIKNLGEENKGKYQDFIKGFLDKNKETEEIINKYENKEFKDISYQKTRREIMRAAIPNLLKQIKIINETIEGEKNKVYARGLIEDTLKKVVSHAGELLGETRINSIGETVPVMTERRVQLENLYKKYFGGKPELIDPRLTEEQNNTQTEKETKETKTNENQEQTKTQEETKIEQQEQEKSKETKPKKKRDRSKTKNIKTTEDVINFIKDWANKKEQDYDKESVQQGIDDAVDLFDNREYLTSGQEEASDEKTPEQVLFEKILDKKPQNYIDALITKITNSRKLIKNQHDLTFLVDAERRLKNINEVGVDEKVSDEQLSKDINDIYSEVFRPYLETAEEETGNTLYSEEDNRQQDKQKEKQRKEKEQERKKKEAEELKKQEELKKKKIEEENMRKQEEAKKKEEEEKRKRQGNLTDEEYKEYEELSKKTIELKEGENTNKDLTRLVELTIKKEGNILDVNGDKIVKKDATVRYMLGMKNAKLFPFKTQKEEKIMDELYNKTFRTVGKKILVPVINGRGVIKEWKHLSEAEIERALNERDVLKNNKITYRLTLRANPDLTAFSYINKSIIASFWRLKNNPKYKDTIFSRGVFVDPAYGEWGFWIDEKGFELKNDFLKKITTNGFDKEDESYKLSDIIDFPEFFDNYPEFKDLKINFKNTLNSSKYTGEYTPRDYEVRFGKEYEHRIDIKKQDLVPRKISQSEKIIKIDGKNIFEHIKEIDAKSYDYIEQKLLKTKIKDFPSLKNFLGKMITEHGANAFLYEFNLNNLNKKKRLSAKDKIKIKEYEEEFKKQTRILETYKKLDEKTKRDTVSFTVPTKEEIKELQKQENDRAKNKLKRIMNTIVHEMTHGSQDVENTLLDSSTTNKYWERYEEISARDSGKRMNDENYAKNPPIINEPYMIKFFKGESSIFINNERNQPTTTKNTTEIQTKERVQQAQQILNKAFPNVRFQYAWHSTPHDFNEFTLNHLLSGEGAMVHGWGLYFSKNLPKNYNNYFTDFNGLDGEGLNGGQLINRTIKGEYFADLLENIWNNDIDTVDEIIDDMSVNGRITEKSAIRELQKRVSSNSQGLTKQQINVINKLILRIQKEGFDKLQGNGKGRLYLANIPDDDVLIRKGATFKEQPPKVQKAIKEILSKELGLTKEEINNILNDPIIKSVDYKKYMDYDKMVSLIGGRIWYDTLENRYKNKRNDNVINIKTLQENYEELTSKLLNKYGVKGISYNGRQDGECFVVFDNKAIDIINKFKKEESKWISEKPQAKKQELTDTQKQRVERKLQEKKQKEEKTVKNNTRYQLHSEEGLSKTNINTPEFKNWFNGSILKNKDGSPKVFYRGIKNHYDPTYDKEEGGAVWITESKEQAEAFRDTNEYEEIVKQTGKKEKLSYHEPMSNVETGDLAEVYANIQKPFNVGQIMDEGSNHEHYMHINNVLQRDVKNGKITEAQRKQVLEDLSYLNKLNKNGEYPQTEHALSHHFPNKKFFNALKKAGYDSIQGYENDVMTYGIFDKGNVKSIYNEGTWDNKNKNMRYMATNKKDNTFTQELVNKKGFTYEIGKDEIFSSTVNSKRFMKMTKEQQDRIKKEAFENDEIARKYTDVFQVTFTKSSQKVLANKKEITYFRNNEQLWNETKNGNNIIFERVNPMEFQTKTMKFEGQNGISIGKRLFEQSEAYKWAARKYREYKIKTFEELFDDTYIIQRRLFDIGRGNIYKHFTNIKDEGWKAEEYIKKGIDYNGKHIRGINEIASEIPKEKQEICLNYFEAMHMIDLYNEDPKLKQRMTKERANEIINKVKQRDDYKQIENWRKEIVEFQQALFYETLVKSGIESEERFNNFIKKRPNYMPLEKFDDEEVDFGEKSYKRISGIVNLKSPIKKLDNSEKQVINIFSVIQNRAFEWSELSARNRAAQITIDAFVNSLNVNEYGETISKGFGLVRRVRVNEKDQSIITKPDNKMRIISILRNGKQEFYQVADPHLCYVLKTLNVEQATVIDKYMEQLGPFINSLLKKYTTAKRTGATLPLDFGLSNVDRDTQVATFTSEHGYIPVIDNIWGMKEFITNGEFKQDYLKQVGPLGEQSRGRLLGNNLFEAAKDYNPNFEKLKKQFATAKTPKEKAQALTNFLKQVHQKTTALEAAKTILWAPVNALEWTGTLLEQSTRIAEHKNGMMGYTSIWDRVLKTLEYGFSEINPDIKRSRGNSTEAAADALLLTLNFRRGGKIGKSLNKYIAFANARLIGIQKIGNFLDSVLTGRDSNNEINRELQVQRIVLMALAVPFILSWTRHLQGDDAWENAPDWERRTHWFFPKDSFMGRLGFGRMSRGEVYGSTFGYAIQNGYDKLLKNPNINKAKLMGGMVYDFLNAFAPLDSSLIEMTFSILPDLFKDVSGLALNKDPFTKQAIISQNLEKQIGYNQKTAYTSALAIDFSTMLADLFGADVSAKKLDYGLTKTFSTSFREVNDLYEALKERITGKKVSYLPGRGYYESEKGRFGEKIDEASPFMKPILKRFSASKSMSRYREEFNEEYIELSKKASDKKENNYFKMTKEEERKWNKYQEVKKDLNKLDKEMRDLLNDKKMDEKRKTIKKQQIENKEIEILKRLKR